MKLTKEQVMVAKAMKERGTSVRQVARQLEVTEGALRYRLKKVSEEGPDPSDGRANQATALDGYEDAVLAVQERLEDSRLTGEGRPCQVRQIYDVLVRDHGYRGSYQAVVRHLRRRYGTPKVRALRRVETPPGVQAQHDWFEVRVTVRPLHQRVHVQARDRSGPDSRHVQYDVGRREDRCPFVGERTFQAPLRMAPSRTPWYHSRERRLAFRAAPTVTLRSAHTTLGYDREIKLPLYATAGVPEVWIVDVEGGVVDVYAEPGEETYRVEERVDPGGTLQPRLLSRVSVPVSAILD